MKTISGWFYAKTIKDVMVYIKTKPFSSRVPDILIQHIGFSKGDNWYNYCVPAGTDWFLDEHLDWFIADCKIKSAWAKMREEVHKR
jgi:hypothetical protein